MYKQQKNFYRLVEVFKFYGEATYSAATCLASFDFKLAALLE